MPISSLEQKREGFFQFPHLKIMTDKYFSYIPNMTHNDGSKFLEEYEKKRGKGHNILKSGDPGQK